MKQVDIYKEALDIMKGVNTDGYWGYGFYHETSIGEFHFVGLCKLLSIIVDHSSKVDHNSNWVKLKNENVQNDLLKDSEKILGKKLDKDSFWFINPKYNVDKAKKERIEHLEKLIKLYEDEK